MKQHNIGKILLLPASPASTVKLKIYRRALIGLLRYMDLRASSPLN